MYSMILLSGVNGFLFKEIVSHLNKFKLKYMTLGRSAGNNIHWNMMDVCPLISPVARVVPVGGKVHVVTRTEAEKNDYFTTNFAGTRNLLAALEKNSSIKTGRS